MTYFCTLASGSEGNCAVYVSGRQRILVDAGKNTRYINERLRELALIYRAYEEARDRTGLEPVDRITRAADRLQDSFFAGTALFVDGFGEFTAPETALLRRALAIMGQEGVTDVRARIMSASEPQSRLMRAFGAELLDQTLLFPGIDL